MVPGRRRCPHLRSPDKGGPLYSIMAHGIAGNHGIAIPIIASTMYVCVGQVDVKINYT